MITPSSNMRIVNLSARLYRSLLILYPADYRRAYGGQMAQVFRDMCRDAFQRGGTWRLAAWWAAALIDLMQTVIAEHRKVNFMMPKAKFIQWSGWFLMIGGVLFAGASISQLQPDSRMALGVYQLALAAIVPAMAAVALGLLGMYFRFSERMEWLGKLALLAAIAGSATTAVGWLLTIVVGEGYWNVFLVGFLGHLVGTSVFGGVVATMRLLPKWNFSVLIGSALPLTLIVLSLSGSSSGTVNNWSAFALFLLISISWLLTGLALNSAPEAAAQPIVSGTV